MKVKVLNECIRNVYTYNNRMSCPTGLADRAKFSDVLNLLCDVLKHSGGVFLKPRDNVQHAMSGENEFFVLP